MWKFKLKDPYYRNIDFLTLTTAMEKEAFPSKSLILTIALLPFFGKWLRGAAPDLRCHVGIRLWSYQHCRATWNWICESEKSASPWFRNSVRLCVYNSLSESVTSTHIKSVSTKVLACMNTLVVWNLCASLSDVTPRGDLIVIELTSLSASWMVT